MGAFNETGLLFFIWPVAALTLLFDYGWSALTLYISLGFAKTADRFLIFKKKLFAVFVTSFGVDALLAGILFLLLILSKLYPALDGWITQPFIGLGGTLAALGCILLVIGGGLLKYVLYRNVVFKKSTDQSPAQRNTLSLILALFTAPWTFLLPTATATAWLGEIMIAIGSLAGDASVPFID